MKAVFENTWVLPDRGVRIFLLCGAERALVIDTGMTGIDVRAAVCEHTALPYTLLNTHADRDHIAANGQFASFYMHPSEAAFYHNVQHGRGTVLPVFDGDEIDLGGRTLEIVHLPGHTPGSIAVLDRANRCLIGGDPIQEDGDIFMFGPQRDLGAYIAGLRRLVRRDDFDWVYPSHGKEKVCRDVIPRLIDGAREILAGKVEGTQTERFGRTIRVCDAGVSRFLCEPLNTERSKTE